MAVQNDYAALKQAFSTYFRRCQGGLGQYGISGVFFVCSAGRQINS